MQNQIENYRWRIVALLFFATTINYIDRQVILGIGEAANFPASVKTVAEWFPKKERALATGIFKEHIKVI
jgi:ACS family hexuronate transporter-like MFS transporter